MLACAELNPVYSTCLEYFYIKLRSSSSSSELSLLYTLLSTDLLPSSPFSTLCSLRISFLALPTLHSALCRSPSYLSLLYTLLSTDLLPSSPYSTLCSLQISFLALPTLHSALYRSPS